MCCHRDRQMRILDLGCGKNKTEGAIGVDLDPAVADVVHDLNRLYYPFRDSSFDLVVCNDILEHVQSVKLVMEEIHRTARPSAIVRIKVPTASSRYYHTDPTHLRAFTSHSFDYFLPGTYIFERYGDQNVRFQHRSIRYVTKDRGVWSRFKTWFANRYSRSYEYHFLFIFQTENLQFELYVDK